MQDSYTVEIFVWSNIEDPTLLSHRYNSFTFNPLNHASPCNGAGVCFEGRISRIVDVNTLDVHGKRIRLVLVDIPERGESGYTEATKFTSALCPLGATVLVDQMGNRCTISIIG